MASTRPIKDRPSSTEKTAGATDQAAAIEQAMARDNVRVGAGHASEVVDHGAQRPTAGRWFGIFVAVVLAALVLWFLFG